jgi:hypothetical protein
LGASRDDSRYRETEDVEAHPMVPSARWGTQWSGGAMAGRICNVGFLPFSVASVEEKKREGKS